MKISSRTQSYLLIAILIVAAILRFNHINQPFIDSNSWRQASTAMMADNYYRRNWNIFYPEISWNGPDPSYNGREFQTVSYIAALLYVVVGQHDWVGRSVAVMFGLWGIFALYKLISCVWDREHALMGAAVMALLPGSIFIDREFLPDPAMVALLTTSCWMLVAYCQKERMQYLLLATAIGTWGFLTKLTGLVVAIPMIYAMLAILGWKRILQPKKLLAIGMAAVFSLALVIAYYLWARYLYLTYPPHHFAGAGSWLWDHGLAKWLSEQYYLPKLYENFKNWIWTKPVIFLVFVGLLLRPPQWNDNSESKSERVLGESVGKAPWLFHWWVLGFAMYYLIGAKHLVDQPYNFHLINPAAAVLAGNAIVALAKLSARIASFGDRIARSPALIATIAAILLIIGGVGQRNLSNVYNPYAEQSYKLGLALRQISQPGDLVTTIPTDIGNPIAIYYSQRRGWIFPPAWSNIPWWDDLPKGEDKGLIADLNQLRSQGADWLGIVNQQKNKIWQSNPIFMQYIQRTCELKQESPDWLIYRILPQKQ
jgi:Dolichyl-phosphate-mannose-protein mannosyltransferase